MRIGEVYHIDMNTTDPTGKIILVGMAEDGPVNRPFVLGENVAPQEMLGNTSLARSLQMLEGAGVNREDILLYRLNGKHGDVTIYAENAAGQEGEPIFRFRTIGASDMDQNGSIVVFPEAVSVQWVERDQGQRTRTYRFSEYANTASLADHINQEAMLGLVPVMVKELAHVDMTTAFAFDREYLFHNAHSEAGYCLRDDVDIETYKLLYWEKFDQGVLGGGEPGEFYSLLRQTPCEAIVLLDMYFDWFPELRTIWAKLAKEKTAEQYTPCVGMMNASPVPHAVPVPSTWVLQEDGSYINEDQEIVLYDAEETFTLYVDKLKQQAADSALERATEGYMAYLHLLVGETFRYETTMPAMLNYAAAYVLNPMEKGLTNKTLPGFYRLEREITKSVVAELSASGYVCIIPSVRRDFVALKSQGFLNLSSFSSLQKPHLLRLTGHLFKQIVAVIDQSIGEPEIRFDSTNIERELDEILSGAVKERKLQDYSLTVVDLEESPIEVRISLVFFGELEKISTTHRINYVNQEVDSWISLD